VLTRRQPLPPTAPPSPPQHRSRAGASALFLTRSRPRQLRKVRATRRVPLSRLLATHTELAPVTPFVATHPKTLDFKSFVCHTSKKTIRVAGNARLNGIRFFGPLSRRIPNPFLVTPILAYTFQNKGLQPACLHTLWKIMGAPALSISRFPLTDTQHGSWTRFTSLCAPGGFGGKSFPSCRSFSPVP
jgi:hypothetical protein